MSRTYVDEVSQVERYKALLTEEYDLRLKLYEAEANEDNLLQNKIRYQLEINNIFVEKGKLNIEATAKFEINPLATVPKIRLLFFESGRAETCFPILVLSSSSSLSCSCSPAI